jgi:hypothetical protein
VVVWLAEQIAVAVHKHSSHPRYRLQDRFSLWSLIAELYASQNRIIEGSTARLNFETLQISRSDEKLLRDFVLLDATYEQYKWEAGWAFTLLQQVASANPCFSIKRQGPDLGTFRIEIVGRYMVERVDGRQRIVCGG